VIQYAAENCAACSGSVGERKGSYLLQSFLRNNMLKEGGVNLAQLTMSAAASRALEAITLACLVIGASLARQASSGTSPPSSNAVWVQLMNTILPTQLRYCHDLL